jgi:putative holliday junction resolvase
MMATECDPTASSVSPREVPGRILAVDYGRKRIGLAISDDLRLTARPLKILQHTNRRDDVRRLRTLVRENQVRCVVVGYPVRLNGEHGDMACEAARFAARLQKELGVLVELVDERLTSWEACNFLRRPTPSSRKHRDSDDVAAAILLRDYLSRCHNRSPVPAGSGQE